ncbi:MAG: hypothetical protein AAF550_13530, partial [Myxococcota bacterium]
MSPTKGYRAGALGTKSDLDTDAVLFQSAGVVGTVDHIAACEAVLELKTPKESTQSEPEFLRSLDRILELANLYYRFLNLLRFQPGYKSTASLERFVRWVNGEVALRGVRLPIRVGEQLLKAEPSASEVFLRPGHTALIPRMWPQLTFSLPLQRVWEFFSAENEPDRRRFGRNRSLLRDSSAAVSMLKVESAAAAIAERLTQNIAKKRDGPQFREAQKLRGFLTIVTYVGLSLYLHSWGRLARGSVPANYHRSDGVLLKD